MTGGSLLKHVKDKFKHEFDIGHVILSGPLPHGVIQRDILEATIVIIPSLWDNMPYTALEAFSSGKFVLVSSKGGIAELLDTDCVNDFCFNPEHEGSIISAIRRALSLSKNEREQLGKEGRNTVMNKCEPSVILPQRILHYESIIKNAYIPHAYPFADIQVKYKSATRESKPGVKLSVIIPFYNLGTTIDECIRSVRDSVMPPEEVIVINDGSDDTQSLTKLKQLEEMRIEGLRIIHQENFGLAETRNRGAHEAKGEYLLFLDADDIIVPEFINKACSILDRYDNIHFVSCWIDCFGENEHIWPGWNPEFPFLLGHNLIIPICVVRKASFLKYGLHRRELEYGYEDWDSWISLVTCGCGGVCMPEILARYRIRKESMYQRIKRSQGRYLYEMIARHHPDVYRRYGLELFLLQNANGPAQDWHQPGAWISPYEELLSQLEKNVLRSD